MLCYIELPLTNLLPKKVLKLSPQEFLPFSLYQPMPKPLVTRLFWTQSQFWQMHTCILSFLQIMWALYLIQFSVSFISYLHTSNHKLTSHLFIHKSTTTHMPSCLRILHHLHHECECKHSLSLSLSGSLSHTHTGTPKAVFSHLTKQSKFLFIFTHLPCRFSICLLEEGQHTNPFAFLLFLCHYSGTALP